ncbi:MAG: endolytic transglycosylase MltG [Dialister sp.]|nr:endolytic transglycosylase MltG [Dialister sp.]
MNIKDAVLTPGKRKRALFCLLAAAIVFCAAGFYYVYNGLGARPSGDVIDVVIPKEATGQEISSVLVRNGIISDGFAFRVVLAVTGEGKRLQSGHYHLRQGLSIRQAVEALHKGADDYITVTIPEGYTVKQMAEVFKKAGVAGGNSFEETAAVYGPLSWQYGPVAVPVRGEGFLFPDTYDVPLDYDAKQICDMMYCRMDSMITADIRQRAEKKSLTLYALITLASMVEREARFKEDQVPIASVMLARLKAGMPLQIDATVQYALGETKPEVTVEDTKVDSPYNTYLCRGLPPGPIGAPGMDAIRSVLDAEPGEYLYYVAEKDGHHVFTKTLEEHRAETRRIYGESS